MSYTLQLIKEGGSVRLDLSAGVLENIPDGVFTLHGHMPAAGTSPVASIGVTLTGPDGQYIAGATGNHRTVPVEGP